MKQCSRTAIAGLVLAVLFASCKGEASATEESIVTVKATVVKSVLVPDEVNGFGSLSFVVKVDVYSPQEAVIETLPFQEGDRVDAGSLVAVLRNPQLTLAVGRAENGLAQAFAALQLADARLIEGRFAVESRLGGIDKAKLELAQARRELSESERKLADQETLLAAGGLTMEAVRSGRFSLESQKERIAIMEADLEISMIGLRDDDLRSGGMTVPPDRTERGRSLMRLATAALSAERAAASAILDAARNELEASRLSVAELRVAAPVTGVIGARYLEVGERVKHDDKIVTIMDVASLYAIAPVREAEAVRLSRGMEAKVRVDATGTEYVGTVSLVSPVADSRTGSFMVRVSIRDPEGRLKPGMFARIVVAAGESRRVAVVPEAAVAGLANGSGTVFVVANGVVDERRVELGEAVGEDRRVLSGIADGDVIVERPKPELREGDRVAVSK
ncbi:MAG: hypothetical protein CVV51_04000 [Spirochaetae bacterium HGW-Spirochaetae-7]|jgi:multidrug efflux pump subunit AcrA (membrane-fusion protein)|nr:MAG: hypothetical protein CVV51_04000 [Spirochaetae bacterium HGW-Spirochaetae-7]